MQTSEPMNVASPPTFISTIGSLFWKRTPQPTFIPVVPTQVIITRDTITYVDPPDCINTSAKRGRSTFGKKQEDESLPSQQSPSLTMPEKHQVFTYPETPRAPNPYRTTFTLPVQDWNTAELGGTRRYCDDDRTSLHDIDLGIPPGHTLLCHPTEPGVYTVAEPKTLARALFLFGFFFPAFWVAGSAIMLMPLRTTVEWEAGKNSLEIEWGCSVIRDTELRWARRCLVALLSEVAVVMLVVAILKWGTSVHV